MPDSSSMTDEELLSYNAGSREHRIWVARQNASTPPAATMSAHEAAHWARKEQERKWRENRERERAEIARHEEEKRKWNQRVLRERAEQKQRDAEEATAKILIESVWAQYAATDLERNHVMKIIQQRMPGSQHDPGAAEIVLLKLRAAYQ
jgi:hypothetical protein